MFKTFYLGFVCMYVCLCVWWRLGVGGVRISIGLALHHYSLLPSSLSHNLINSLFSVKYFLASYQGFTYWFCYVLFFWSHFCQSLLDLFMFTTMTITTVLFYLVLIFVYFMRS